MTSVVEQSIERLVSKDLAFAIQGSIASTATAKSGCGCTTYRQLLLLNMHHTQRCIEQNMCMVSWSELNRRLCARNEQCLIALINIIFSVAQCGAFHVTGSNWHTHLACSCFMGDLTICLTCLNSGTSMPQISSAKVSLRFARGLLKMYSHSTHGQQNPYHSQLKREQQSVDEEVVLRGKLQNRQRTVPQSKTVVTKAVPSKASCVWPVWCIGLIRLSVLAS